MAQNIPLYAENINTKQEVARTETGTFYETLPFYISVGVIVAILLFVALREFFAWYWKINKIVGLLEEISHNTTQKEMQTSKLDK